MSFSKWQTHLCYFQENTCQKPILNNYSLSGSLISKWCSMRKADIQPAVETILSMLFLEINHHALVYRRSMLYAYSHFITWNIKKTWTQKMWDWMKLILFFCCFVMGILKWNWYFLKNWDSEEHSDYQRLVPLPWFLQRLQKFYPPLLFAPSIQIEKGKYCLSFLIKIFLTCVPPEKVLRKPRGLGTILWELLR